VNENLAVSGGGQLMAGPNQVFPKLKVIVDFTVEDGHHVAVFIGHRLIAGIDIDDGQPPNSEPNANLAELALVVRPSMPKRFQRSSAGRGLERGVRRVPTSDTTHVFRSSFDHID
jgi:hypothetical protein